MPLAEFPSEHGRVVLVQVSGEEESDGPVLRGGLGWSGHLVRAETTFEAALETIAVVAQGVLGQLAGMARSPEEVRVEFGLELTAKAGTILATAGAAAHLKVELTWRSQRDQAI